MSDKEKTFEHIDKVLAAVDSFTNAVSYSEHKWHWSKLRVYAEALFARGPFKPGDRVCLTETPEITKEKSWGWLGSKHFLVTGALGTVHSVDFYDDHFCADIYWDDESWIDFQGVKHMEHPEDRSLYRLWDTQLRRVSDEA